MDDLGADMLRPWTLFLGSKRVQLPHGSKYLLRGIGHLQRYCVAPHSRTIIAKMRSVILDVAMMRKDLGAQTTLAFDATEDYAYDGTPSTTL